MRLVIPVRSGGRAESLSISGAAGNGVNVTLSLTRLFRLLSASVFFGLAAAVLPSAAHGGDFVYTAAAPNPGCSTPCGSEIFTQREDGTERRRLTTRGCYGSPRWSPDGRKIAFFGGPCGSAATRIWTMDADGSGPRQVTTHLVRDENDPDRWVEDRWVEEREPTWSPDGRHLLISRRTDWGPHSRHIWRVSADATGDEVLLTDRFPEVEEEPDYAPDGGTFAFIRSDEVKDGITTLWIASADGSSPRQVALSDIGQGVRHPRYSPDGSHLAFSTIHHTHTLRLADGELRTWGPVATWAPVWAPDGRSLAVRHIRPDRVFPGGGWIVTDDRVPGYYRLSLHAGGELARLPVPLAADGLDWRGSQVAAVARRATDPLPQAWFLLPPAPPARRAKAAAPSAPRPRAIARSAVHFVAADSGGVRGVSLAVDRRIGGGQCRPFVRGKLRAHRRCGSPRFTRVPSRAAWARTFSRLPPGPYRLSLRGEGRTGQRGRPSTVEVTLRR